MQFSKTAIFALSAFIGCAVADLHTRALCVDTGDGYMIYNEAATIAACTAYKNRNTGDSQWDQCPDCTYVTTSPAHCQSDGWHLGGDEINYYCEQNGASKAVASE
ncbi:hypothetical protein BGZ60DRAFT_445442 [Tricladium varicosporioides]|nr:hypothetical protein BGZ60DRAFT_445442 [Hymenoscyphus varicosporioides]